MLGVLILIKPNIRRNIIATSVQNMDITAVARGVVHVKVLRLMLIVVHQLIVIHVNMLNVVIDFELPEF